MDIFIIVLGFLKTTLTRPPSSPLRVPFFGRPRDSNDHVARRREHHVVAIEISPWRRNRHRHTRRANIDNGDPIFMHE
jgi:hypothetical protein